MIKISFIVKIICLLVELDKNLGFIEILRMICSSRIYIHYTPVLIDGRQPRENGNKWIDKAR